MKNKIYKGALGGIVSLTIILGLSACSTPSTTNTSGTSTDTSISLNQNAPVSTTTQTPQTRVS